MTKQLYVLFFILFTGLFTASEIAAQANLSFQGILKKANGLAVDDGPYNITFILYNVETGGNAGNIEHEETISGVEVAGGIYSVILGTDTTNNPLDAAFDKPYFLGIRVGTGAEMVPRIRLTSAPYALALRGSSNIFPGSGQVQADRINLNGSVRAKGGVPTTSNFGTGYLFSSDGDGDGGLFSPEDGVVSIYTNNAERIRVANTSSESRIALKNNVTIDNSLTITDQLLVNGNVSTDLKFANQKGLQYNGLSDWRLVDRDDFTSGTDSWIGTSSLISSTLSTIENVSYGDFNGNVIRPMGPSNTPVLKKQFNLSGVGSYSYVKIVFKYYFTDSWDFDEEVGIAGFSTDLNATNPVICWQQMNVVYTENAAISYEGSNFTDGATIAQMVASNPGTSFYVFVGMKASEGTGNERYALGNVEVWVR